MTYPLGYLYPNEFAEPLVWLPTLFAYSLLISGTDLLILALAAYLFGRLKKPYRYCSPSAWRSSQWCSSGLSPI